MEAEERQEMDDDEVIRFGIGGIEGCGEYIHQKGM